MKSLYLWIDLCTVIVPFAFSFHPKLQFHKKFKHFFIANFLIALIFICWDENFTIQQIWGFNPRYVCGIYLMHLPLEEILFFVCIPFSCLFTYHSLNLFFKTGWNNSIENTFVIILSGILLIVGLLFLNHLYTSVTFISTAIILLILKFSVKVTWLSKFISIYPVLLIPFFIVNGILTGTGIAEPVVWYNNAQNLGIRLLTIPVEDVFYGFELLLLNIFIYEKLENKNMQRFEPSPDQIIN